MKKLKVVGLNFDHMHMGDLLRQCHEHREVEIAGICDADPSRMQSAITNFKIPAARVFTDPERCLAETEPNFVVLCPATAQHAEYVELARWDDKVRWVCIESSGVSCAYLSFDWARRTEIEAAQNSVVTFRQTLLEIVTKTQIER